MAFLLSSPVRCGEPIVAPARIGWRRVCQDSSNAPRRGRRRSSQYQHVLIIPSLQIAGALILSVLHSWRDCLMASRVQQGRWGVGRVHFVIMTWCSRFVISIQGLPDFCRGNTAGPGRCGIFLESDSPPGFHLYPCDPLRPILFFCVDRQEKGSIFR